MNVEKTTLYLDKALRRRLRLAAAETGTTMTSLIAAGARLVLKRVGDAPSPRTASRRSRRAFDRMLRGYGRSNPGSAVPVDDVVYGLGAHAKERPGK